MSDDVHVVGLTGQSGAGKTTVCKVFEENGFAVVNCDLISRQVTEKESPCLSQLAECFGKDIIRPDGTLDRRKLGNIVFGNRELLYQLNGICYPYITYQIVERLKAFKESGQRYVLLDAPTLFESRADDFCDLIISVTADKESRLKRILERDGITEEQALKRFASQHTEEFFRNRSDYIIINNKDIPILIEKAKEVSDKVKEYFNAQTD